MIHTVHHTHKKGITYTVANKHVLADMGWLVNEGHTTCKDMSLHHKGKVVHFFIEVLHEAGEVPNAN